MGATFLNRSVECLQFSTIQRQFRFADRSRKYVRDDCSALRRQQKR